MRVLALILAVTLCPGVAEAAEDFAHYVAEGHTLHEPAVAEASHEGHDDHEKEHGDDEHGCTALFHLCGCHSPTPSQVTVRLEVHRSADLHATVAGVLAFLDRRPRDGVRGETFRPPIA